MPKRAIEINIDRIRAWMNNPNAKESDLSKKDREIYERWDYAYDQLKLEKPSVVVNRLVKKFRISTSQARIDIRNCQKLLNPINRREAEWIRNYIVEDAMLQVKAARESNNHRAWQKARADLIKIYQIDKEDKALIDPQELGHNSYYITINFGGKLQKIDMSKLSNLEVDEKTKLTDFLFSDIEIEDAKEIMDS